MVNTPLNYFAYNKAYYCWPHSLKHTILVINKSNSEISGTIFLSKIIIHLLQNTNIDITLNSLHTRVLS